MLFRICGSKLDAVERTLFVCVQRTSTTGVCIPYHLFGICGRLCHDARYFSSIACTVNQMIATNCSVGEEGTLCEQGLELQSLQFLTYQFHLGQHVVDEVIQVLGRFQPQLSGHWVEQSLHMAIVGMQGLEKPFNRFLIEIEENARSVQQCGGTSR